MKFFGKIVVLVFILLGVLSIYWKVRQLPKKYQPSFKNYKLDKIIGKIEYIASTPENIPVKKSWPTPIPPTIVVSPAPTDDGQEWGKATQVSEHTWTMKVGFDETMATAQEIFEALNNYRRQHSREALTWDDRLADFAQSRASNFTNIGQTDEHAGFVSYTDNIDNVKALGFWSLGENSSFGYRLTGVHLIEWVYAGDEGHNSNQLNSEWSHVGIGVDGNQTDIIFGGNKI